MGNTLWKRAAIAGLVAIALAGCGSSGERGSPFATAGPVAAQKPDEFAFKHAVRVKKLEGLDETVRRNLKVVLSTDDFTESLRHSLQNDEMLAPKEKDAEYELIPYFVDLRTAPVSDRVTAAQAVFQYQIIRLHDNTTLFNRRIKAEFSSIADPSFDEGNMVDRTLRFVGLGNSDPVAAAIANSGPEESRAAGPERETAREIHAARNAVALNIRQTMRELIVASPERITFMPKVNGPTAPQSDVESEAPAPAADENGEVQPPVPVQEEVSGE